MSKIEKIIGQIIKDNIEFYGYSTKEVSLLSGIDEFKLSKLIAGKDKITYESSKKLSFVFKGMKDDPSMLFDIYQKMLNQENINKEEEQLISYLEKEKQDFNLLQKESQINSIKNIFPGNSMKTFNSFLLHSNASFAKYKNKPEVHLWIALMFEKYAKENNDNPFKKTTVPSIINKIFEIFFNKTPFNEREKTISHFLYEKGIILKNGPSIYNSSIRGVSFKKKNNRYIFLTDKYKREYWWLISLVHELLHFYLNIKSETQIEKKAVKLIHQYIAKYKIIDKDFEIFFELAPSHFNKDKHIFNKLEDATHKKICFGNPRKLIDLIK